MRRPSPSPATGPPAASPALPERLRLHLLDLLEHRAEPWLAELPRVVATYCEKWSFTLDAFLDDGWNGYVAAGSRGERRIVFKISPDLPRAQAEIEGLLIRNAAGVPRVLEHDIDSGAVLMERIDKARDLSALPPERDATMAELANILHIEDPPQPEHVVSLIDSLEEWWEWLETLNEELSQPIDASLMRSGILEARTLSQTSEARYLLHGDFEARNMIVAEGGPVALDSPSIIGEREFDLASWIVSETPPQAAIRVLRMARLTATDSERIWRWMWPFLIERELERRRLEVDDGTARPESHIADDVRPHLSVSVSGPLVRR